MSAPERDNEALRTLAAIPFLDWLELAAVSGMAEVTAHRALCRLRRDGLVGHVRHASALVAPTRRWYATADGLCRVAQHEGTGLERLLRTHPVTAHWQRILLGRLDAVAVIYRLAATVADAGDCFPRFRWYRSLPLDAAMTLDDGRTLGVIRQGATADRTGFSDRIGRLLDPDLSRPRALLALLPDDARLRQTRRLLARYPGPVYLATEQDVARSLADDPIWHIPSASTRLSFREVLTNLRAGGGLTWEPPLSRGALAPELPELAESEDVPVYLLPALLKPTEKRMLDCLADWPFITVKDLCGVLDLSDSRVWRLAAHLDRLGLVSTVLLEGQRRLGLSRGGLALLGRRDRVSVSRAVQRWSVEPEDGRSTVTWREIPGVRSRPLARTIEHTQAVHRFMADLVRQADRNPGFRVLQISPPHHSTRYFPHRGRLRSVHPDGFGVVRVGAKTLPFFLEWERRALNPSTMSARLAPYLRYYSSHRPLDDHGHRPLVLVVFDDYLAEGNFLGVARGEMERAGVDVPLWVSYRELLEKDGPLGQVWRSPEVLEPSSPFR